METTTPILKEKKLNGTVVWIDQEIKDDWLNLSQSGRLSGKEAKMMSHFIKNTVKAKINALKSVPVGGSNANN